MLDIAVHDELLDAPLSHASDNLLATFGDRCITQRNGCQRAVFDGRGNLPHHDVIYVHEYLHLTSQQGRAARCRTMRFHPAARPTAIHLAGTSCHYATDTSLALAASRFSPMVRMAFVATKDTTVVTRPIMMASQK